MLLEKLISPLVPVLSLTDTGHSALQLMEENNLDVLPLVSDEKYIALIKENDLLDWDVPSSPLILANSLHYKPAMPASGHPYDAMRLAHVQHLSIIPVIDNESNYLGCIKREDLLGFVTENGGMQLPGAIIVLEIEPRDYTLFEIARICENEDVGITNTQLHTIPETGMLELTIKTNRSDLQGVVSSMERHNYKVKDVYGEQAQDENMKDRFNLLMTYINM
jgi:acetoin utilization protein AcuB